MPIPQQPQNNIPRRFSVEWTRGGSVDTRPVGSYIAPEQNIAGTPTAPKLVASDQAPFTVQMSGNLAANATQTLQATVAFVAAPPLTVPSGYTLSTQGTLSVTHSIAGLNIASSNIAIVGRTPKLGQVAGSTFAAGFTYTAWGGYITIVLTNSSGGVITAGTISGRAIVQFWMYNGDLAAGVNVQASVGGGQPGSGITGNPIPQGGNILSPGRAIPGGDNAPPRL